MILTRRPGSGSTRSPTRRRRLCGCTLGGLAHGLTVGGVEDLVREGEQITDTVARGAEVDDGVGGGVFVRRDGAGALRATADVATGDAAGATAITRLGAGFWDAWVFS